MRPAIAGSGGRDRHVVDESGAVHGVGRRGNRTVPSAWDQRAVPLGIEDRDGLGAAAQRQVHHQRVDVGAGPSGVQRLAAVQPGGVVGRPASAAEREDAVEPAGQTPSSAERDPGPDVPGGPPDAPRPALGPGAPERQSVAIRVATLVPSIYPIDSRGNRLLTIENKADRSRIQGRIEGKRLNIRRLLHFFADSLSRRRRQTAIRGRSRSERRSVEGQVT